MQARNLAQNNHLNVLILFLLSLHMCIDGQKIAKKLCLQITKESREVQSLLGEYNAILESQVDAISSSEAFNPCALRSRLQLLGVQATGARLEERQEVIQAYLTLTRSMEEMELLKEDIKNVISYYEQVKATVLHEIECLAKKFDSLSRGTKALLHNFWADNEILLERGRITAQAISSSVCLSPTILDDYSSDSDTSDCD